MTVATANPETISNPHHTTYLVYYGGQVAFKSDGSGVVQDSGDFADPREPYNQFVEAAPTDSPAAINQIFSIIAAGGQPQGFFNGINYYFEVFTDNPADYTFSNSSVFIDLHQSTQHGGFAEGDTLVDISSVTGSFFDDVIRGSSPGDFPADSTSIVVNGVNTQSLLHFTINNPGNNFLVGGNGSDVLEGRGGADILVGGSATADFFTDFASYESSPAAVTVQLAGVGNNDTQAAIATGGDAAGDILEGIEGLLGSRFDDILTGNSLDNVLAGGLGNDKIDGKGGNNTVDYSRDHFFDRISVLSTDTADKVVVALGLNGAVGTGAEFKAHLTPGLPGGGGGVTFDQVSVDQLKNIENVTGTTGADTITGNEQNNILDGREGNDTLDGGFADDTLIGGAGNNTASYVSHDAGTVPVGEQDIIALGLNGAAGSFNRSEFSRTGPSIVETDVLRDIANVTGSNRAETITGNEQQNFIDGRGGDDIINGGGGSDGLDGGFGNDTLIGGGGNDTAVYLSHDGGSTLLGEQDVISLGLNGADGSFTRTQLVARPTIHVEIVEQDILRTINNVTGSDHSETINGNEGDNALVGRGGNDNLNGGAGNDRYDYSGSFGVAFGNDQIFDADGSADKIVVDSFSGITAQHTGDDLILTLAGGTIRILNHFVAGHAVENIVDAQGNSMVLATGNTGGNGSGILVADNKGETLDGKGGDDFLFGGTGNDRLIGGDGNDKLTGGKGTDTFVFAPGFGHDVVTDFNAGNHFQFDLRWLALPEPHGWNQEFGHELDTAHDRIEFDGGSFHNFRDIIAASHQVGNDTVITLDQNNSITLQNVAVHDLHASDFLFRP